MNLYIFDQLLFSLLSIQEKCNNCIVGYNISSEIMYFVTASQGGGFGSLDQTGKTKVLPTVAKKRSGAKSTTKYLSWGRSSD